LEVASLLGAINNIFTYLVITKRAMPLGQDAVVLSFGFSWVSTVSNLN
jgi:hypothetical protein